jgi:NAD/NADP transhydrogenase beta subunit
MWQVTYLVLLTYAALVAAPTSIGDREDVANLVWVAANSVCAAVAFVTAGLASMYLRSLHQADTKRLEEVYAAGKKLPLVLDLHGWTEAPKPNWRLILVLRITVWIGALLAIGINLSRIPQVVAWISQLASGGP